MDRLIDYLSFLYADFPTRTDYLFFGALIAILATVSAGLAARNAFRGN